MFFTTVCLISCTGKQESDIITWQLAKGDFVEKLNVPGTVKAVSNKAVSAPRNNYGMLTVTRIAEDGAFVRKGDTICVVSSPELEAAYRDLLTSIEKREAGLTKAEADYRLDISLIHAQLESAESQLGIASLNALKMKYTPPYQQELLKLELKKANIEKEKLEKKLANTIKIRDSDLRQKKAVMDREKMRAKSMLDQIASMALIADRDGIVMRAVMPVFSVVSSVGSGTFGGQVREGTVLFDPQVLNFPDLSRMEISADVPEADFKVIQNGQHVNITVDAEDTLVTTGKVKRKSLAAGQAQRYSQSKVKSYEVIIEIDICHAKMKPGLSTICEIIIKEAKDTLFVPTVAIHQKDSSEFVYVKRKNKFVPVSIKTGTAGSSLTLIASGLSGNEVIALTKPNDRFIAKEQSKKNNPKTN